MGDGYKKVIIYCEGDTVDAYFEGNFIARLFATESADDYVVHTPLSDKRYSGRTIREAVGNWLLRE